MQQLPLEILIEIFNYVPEMILNLSRVSKYFREIATNQIKRVELCLEQEAESEILAISDEMRNFKTTINLKLKLAFDVNIAEKAELCAIHSDKIQTLIFSEFSFLNPFFDQYDVFYDQLESLEILNCDLTSSSNELSNFVLKSCVNLKNLTICGCSGMEIDELNKIGRELSNTKIEKLQLHPTYSYFDMSSSAHNDESWTIENLKMLSVRSKLVVMKKNFVKNMLSTRNRQKFPNLKKLELIAELDCGTNFVPSLIYQFPNLENIAIGKGVVLVRNNDFSLICNQYKNLRSLEFHFVQKDEQLELKHRLLKNDKLTDLTIGITKNIITTEHLDRISKSLPNLRKLKLIVYYLISDSKLFIQQIIKIFPQIKELNFSHIGQLENINILF